VDARHTMIGLRTPVGANFPVHCTAVGKAVLAHLPEDEIDAILLVNALTRYTSSTITRISELKERLRQIVQRGYARDDQELERGLSGVAAPVRTSDGHVIAAVGMAGPTTRFRGGELARKVALTRAAADKIAACLGNNANVRAIS
jgi:DNA-binding IclR family transcriptional regulator